MTDQQETKVFNRDCVKKDCIWIAFLSSFSICVFAPLEYLIISLTISLYVQGNFVLVPYEEITGENVVWENYSAYN